MLRQSRGSFQPIRHSIEPVGYCLLGVRVAMQRREFIGLVGGAAAWPVAVRAQSSKRIPVVGVLWAYADAEAAGSSRLALLKGLAEFGYGPGKTFKLEERFAGEVAERYGTLAAELVNLKVDVLVSQGGAPTVALHRATSTIPVVFVGVADPVAQGFVVSLSKPGRNMSGMSQMSADVSSKRLQFLQKAIPALSHVALLGDPTNTGNPLEMAQLSSAARELGLSYEVFGASTRNDIDQAFQRIETQHFLAAVVGAANFLNSERKQISALGLRHRLALIGPYKYYVEAGSLLSYGVDIPTLYHGAAHIVDKVLRGESIGDIPVQQPTRFYFCINLRTAKALGITIPPSLLARADEVIE